MKRRANERVRKLQALLDLRDREQLMVSHDVHDGLVQDLVAAKMYLEAALANSSAERDEPIREAVRLLDRAIAEGRRLVTDLRPIRSPEKADLVADLTSMVEELQRSTDVPIRVDLRIPSCSPSAPVAHVVRNIVRESINNAVRHARSSEIRLTLHQAEDRLIIRTVDDGIGFDRSDVPANRFGLRGIEERANALDGVAEITSRPGQGTTVRVELPWGDDEASQQNATEEP